MFELSAGQIVADKYRVDGVVGTGAMGVIVAATHLTLHQRVAIKLLRDMSPEGRARFQREARLLVRLKSSHVARVFDVGALDDDTPYIVMEHLEGSDLSSVLAARGRLSVEEAVDYVLQACEAVAEAHTLGMVHRDLKPANLFLARGAGETTSIKVLDFGVSKVLDDDPTGRPDEPRGGDLTREGVALGSPGYMSPEQIMNARDVDERSDIFAIGAILYRFVTGETAYPGSSVVAMLATMATDGLTPVRKLAPEVPEAFGAVVERCLAQDKAARYPTVAHVAQALSPYATRRGRAIVDEIFATLNIPLSDESLGDTVVRPTLPPRPAAPVGQQAPLPPPSEEPPTLGRVAREALRAELPHPAMIAIVAAVFVLFAAGVAWRALGRPPRAVPAAAPVVAAPVLAAPVVAAPVVAAPVVAEPGVTEPDVTEPGVAEPSATEPIVTGSASEPGASVPKVAPPTRPRRPPRTRAPGAIPAGRY